MKMGGLHQFLFVVVATSTFLAIFTVLTTLNSLEAPKDGDGEVDLYHLLEKHSAGDPTRSTKKTGPISLARVERKLPDLDNKDDDDFDDDADPEETSNNSDEEEENQFVPATIQKALASLNTNDPVKTRNDDDDVNYKSILKKWEMPNGAIRILRKIRHRPIAFDYDREKDILALRHPLKTGGTSFSNMLRKIFTTKKVFPGSGESQWFKPDVLENAIAIHPPDKNKQYWRDLKTLYTHTHLRSHNKKQPFLDHLREKVPVLKEKRFRLMTIVRRPLDLAASRFYETRCRIGTYSGQRGVKNITECPQVNLASIKLEMQKGKEECDAGTRTHMCHFLNLKSQKDIEICGSVDKFVQSYWSYNQMHRDLMGSLPTPPGLKNSRTPTLNDVAFYTIRDLGGMIDAHPEYKEDFIFFLITERMKESLCLFHYHFQIEPVEERHSLYKHCRPLDFWTERQKQDLEERNPFDYTVWRAANAVMDVRLAAMRLEIKARLDAGETLDQIPFLKAGCYNETEI